MAWPIDNLDLSALDDPSTDKPSEARPQLLAIGNKVKEIIASPPILRGALVYMNANQSIANDTNVYNISFQGEAYDTDNCHAPNGTTLIVPSGASYIRLTAKVTWEANASGYRDFVILKNGSLTGNYLGAPHSRINPISGALTKQLLTSPVLPVVPTDTFGFLVYQNSGTALNIIGSSNGTDTWFSMEIIGVQ